MKIGIDITPLSTDHQYRGVGSVFLKRKSFKMINNPQTFYKIFTHNWVIVSIAITLTMSLLLGLILGILPQPIIAVGLLLFGGLIIGSIANPMFGGILIIFSSPFTFLAWNGFGFNIRPFEIFTVTTLFGLLMHSLLGRHRFFGTKLDFPYFLFWLTLLISLMINGPNRFGIIMLVIYGVLGVMNYVLVNVLNNETKIKRAIDVLVIVGDIAAGIGFLQVVGYYLGFQAKLFQGVHHFIVEFGRPIGPFYDPAWYGIFSAFIFLILLPLVSNQSGLKKVFYYFSLIAQLLAVLLSFARAAWLGALVGLFIFGFIQVRSKQKTSRSTFVYVLFFLFITLAVWQQFSPNTYTAFVNRASGVDKEGSALVRVYFTKTSLQAISQKPIFGYGIGSWGSNLLDERVIMGPNMMVDILYDSGVFGLLSWLLLLFALLLPLVSNILSPITDSLTPYIRGIFLGLSGIFTAFMFSAGYNYEWFWMAVAFGVSIARVAKNLRQKTLKDRIEAS